MYASLVFHSIIDAKINGRAFLSLSENGLERSGVSLGFQYTLMDIKIIEELVCVLLQCIAAIEKKDLKKICMYTCMHVEGKITNI